MFWVTKWAIVVLRNIQFTPTKRLASLIRPISTTGLLFDGNAHMINSSLPDQATVGAFCSSISQTGKFPCSAS